LIQCCEEGTISARRNKTIYRDVNTEGYTLLELLVVISIISVVMGILLPVLSKSRRHARAVLGIQNQHEIAGAIHLYATDNSGQYPESVATIGSRFGWNWQEPTVMTSIISRAPHLHRAMSEYLRSYIKDASIMFCPNAPRQYKYLQESWDAGDKWNNPDTRLRLDWVKGTYCFYWNYVGLLEKRRLFIGPRNSFGGKWQSKLLMSCYLGSDSYRSPGSFGSCEKFKRASIVPEAMASSSYWSRIKPKNAFRDALDINLQATYTDGHVESYKPSETVPMKVIKDRAHKIPYKYGPGIFYIPQKAIQ